MTSIIPQQARDSIGEVLHRREGAVTASHIRKFAVAVGNDNPIYNDRNAAQSAGFADLVAPPLFAAAATRPIPPRREIRVDGQFPGMAPPGMEACQTILARQKWSFERPIVAGESLVESARLISLTEKQGRQGPFCLAVSKTEITSGDEVVELSELTLALRPLSGIMPAKTIAMPAGEASSSIADESYSDGVLTKCPDMISTFMFCAATWAVHRIHYDAAYARTEGLAAPIVPGWLQASYLIHLAELQQGPQRRIASLEASYRSTANVGELLHCSSPDNGSEGDLHISTAAGTTPVTAKYTYTNLAG